MLAAYWRFSGSEIHTDRKAASGKVWKQLTAAGCRSQPAQSCSTLTVFVRAVLPTQYLLDLSRIFSSRSVALTSGLDSIFIPLKYSAAEKRIPDMSYESYFPSLSFVYKIKSSVSVPKILL
jgi:hypothetical protein